MRKEIVLKKKKKIMYTVALYLGVLKLILAIFDVPQTTETKLLFCRAF